LCMALAGRNHGLLEVWAEGSAWANSLTRYSGGQSVATGSRGIQLEKFDAKPFTYTQRKTGDSIRIRLATAMLSGWQPDVVGHFLGGCRQLRDGLDARWFFVRPEAIYCEGPQVSAGQYTAAQDRMQRAVRRLNEAGLAAGADAASGRRWALPLTPAARARFKDWRWSWLQSIMTTTGGQPSGWAAKAPGAVLRIACIAATLEWAAGDAPPTQLADASIGIGIIDAAIKARAVWLEQHRTRVEMECGQPQAEQLAETLARHCVLAGVAVIDTVGLRRETCLPGLRTDEAVLVAVRELGACGWLKPGQVLPMDLRRESMPPEIHLAPGVIAAARRHLHLDD